jgi:5-methylcytosine-specific restriction endonuclease McrA
MDEATRNYLRDRAGSCCEYCGLDQEALKWADFTLDHIRAKRHGGSDDTDNLAYACIQCNLHKGPNLAGIDPETDQCSVCVHWLRDEKDHID